MALLDFLKSTTRQTKKKEEVKRPKDIKQKIEKGKKMPKPMEAKRKEGKKERVFYKKETPKAKDAPGSIKLKESKTAWDVLIEPHVTEKSTALTSFNQYTFRVFDDATKPEVKRAINEIYGVHVELVRKIRIARKQRSRSQRRNKQIGWRSGYTKAVVTLRKGDKIEVLPH